MLSVRLAEPKDLLEILDIYATARIFMAKNGNPAQWGSRHPCQELVEKDIQQKQLYVICEDFNLCGVFALIFGEDPTYTYIENGAWHHGDAYATIHRIAGNGKTKGIFEAAVAYARKQINHIRVDTHEKNTVMQHVINKTGFSYCGIIYLENGDPRLAYDYHA